ncbi:MAG: ATP-binding protein [Candidatus Gracilibacteria bacterium]|nr:ATP-binding protein [Candidatus Gracilibacteria bacterium]
MHVLLCGISGVGKTTLAKQLSKDFGLICSTSSDDIHTWIRKNFGFLGQGELDINSPEYKITQLITKVYQQVEILLQSRRKNMVIDAANQTEKIRSRIAKLLPEKPIIIYITCNQEELYHRLQNRDNPEVWLELHLKQKTSFEPPENPDIIYNTSTDSYEYVKHQIALRGKNK